MREPKYLVLSGGGPLTLRAIGPARLPPASSQVASAKLGAKCAGADYARRRTLDRDGVARSAALEPCIPPSSTREMQRGDDCCSGGYGKLGPLRLDRHDALQPLQNRTVAATRQPDALASPRPEPRAARTVVPERRRWRARSRAGRRRQEDGAPRGSAERAASARMRVSSQRASSHNGVVGSSRRALPFSGR